jgi:PAS domain S-box-containing protein
VDTAQLLQLRIDALQRDLERATGENAELRTQLGLRAAREAELQAVCDRLLQATTAADVGIWEWDVGENSVVWDEHTYRLYGCKASDFPSAVEAWQAVVHAEDRALVSDLARRAMDGLATFDITFRVMGSGPAMRYLRATASVTRDPNGKPLRLLGIVRDITSKALAQEQLKRNEERWNLALQGSGDGVWDWDLVTGEIFLSHRSREILGFAGEELTTSAAREVLIHPDDLERTSEELQRHLRGETTQFDCEYRVRSKDGSYVWIQGLGRVIARDGQGKALRIVGTHKNIAERRWVREALEGREALLREFITHTPAAIAMLDRDLRYLYASTRWLADHGLAGQDIIGRSHYEVLPDLPERWKDVHRRVLGGAVESCSEDSLPKADGSIEWLQWEAHPWHDTSGQVGGLVLFRHVITERKQLELRLEEQNRQLNRSNAELEQFAYVASHDLQEPLRAISGCAQILAQRCSGSLDADKNALLEHVVAGAARMKALIEGLLSLSRVASGAQILASVSAADIVQRALRNLETSIADQGASVSVAALPNVAADPTQLLQLFQNLIGNALKYRGGAAPAVAVTCVQRGGFQQFSVHDNGIGIEPQYFERIFGVFQRLHTREEYPGTGIGLAICRKIVERHGGKLWLESSPGNGSTFHFTLETAK